MNLKRLLIWGNFTFLLEIHKRLENARRRPIISNSGAPTEKAAEFLNFHLKSIMQNGASYIKDSNDFKSKIKNIDIPNDALLLTADVVGLYPSILIVCTPSLSARGEGDFFQGGLPLSRKK